MKAVPGNLVCTVAWCSLGLCIACGLTACVDESLEADACACDSSTCPADVCAVRVRLPTACAASFSSAEVSLANSSIGQASPGEPFQSCQTIPVGESAEVQLSASGVELPAVPFTCEAGGAPVDLPVCSMRFALGESCRDSVASATVLVAGEEVGEITVDEPLIPCFLLAPNESTSTVIRASSSLSLPSTILCDEQGTQQRLTLECP